MHASQEMLSQWLPGDGRGSQGLPQGIHSVTDALLKANLGHLAQQFQ